MDSSAAVEVTRKAGATAQLRDFRLLVDDQEVGRLGEADKKRVSLMPGTHTVRLRIDWCGSREVTIEPRAGEVVELACRAPGLGLWNVFRARSYIDLRPADVRFPPQRSAGGELGLRLGLSFGATVFMVIVVLPALLVAKVSPSIGGLVIASVLGASGLALIFGRIPTQKGSRPGAEVEPTVR